MDSGDGRTVSRSASGHCDAESIRVRLERRCDCVESICRVLTSATTGVASSLDTNTKGTAIVVYNPLNINREDVVEAAVTFPDGTPKAVRVFGPDGRAVPAQLSNGKVIFVANVPSVGFAVYNVAATDPGREHDDYLATSNSAELKASVSSLENDLYRVTIDRNGDVSGIFDKKIKRELLSAPIRLAISTDNPRQWRHGTWISKTSSGRRARSLAGSARFASLKTGGAGGRRSRTRHRRFKVRADDQSVSR